MQKMQHNPGLGSLSGKASFAPIPLVAASDYPPLPLQPFFACLRLDWLILTKKHWRLLGERVAVTLQIALRSLSAVIILFVLTRILGKKQISQLTMFEYILGITLGELAGFLSTDLEAHYLHGLVALLVLGKWLMRRALGRVIVQGG